MTWPSFDTVMDLVCLTPQLAQLTVWTPGSKISGACNAPAQVQSTGRATSSFMQTCSVQGLGSEELFVVTVQRAESSREIGTSEEMAAGADAGAGGAEAGGADGLQAPIKVRSGMAAQTARIVTSPWP